MPGPNDMAQPAESRGAHHRVEHEHHGGRRHVAVAAQHFAGIGERFRLEIEGALHRIDHRSAAGMHRPEVDGGGRRRTTDELTEARRRRQDGPTSLLPSWQAARTLWSWVPILGVHERTDETTMPERIAGLTFERNAPSERGSFVVRSGNRRSPLFRWPSLYRTNPIHIQQRGKRVGPRTA
jgi:hypothetical protein